MIGGAAMVAINNARHIVGGDNPSSTGEWIFLALLAVCAVIVVCWAVWELWKGGKQ